MRLKGGELLLDLTKLGDISELDADETTASLLFDQSLSQYIHNDCFISPKKIRIAIKWSANIILIDSFALDDVVASDSTIYRFTYGANVYNLRILIDGAPEVYIDIYRVS